jgi:hypothetical protein
MRSAAKDPLNAEAIVELSIEAKWHLMQLLEAFPVSARAQLSEHVAQLPCVRADDESRASPRRRAAGAGSRGCRRHRA